MIINKKVSCKNRFGFTLIELIVSLGLLSLVLLIAYNMNSFGSNVFAKGGSKSDIQASCRIAANYITKELRYASNVTVLSGMPVTPTSGVEYIYVSSGKIKHYDGTTSKDIYGGTSGIASTLQFQYQNDEILKFTISGILKSETYEMNSSVLLLNNGLLVSSNGSVVSYKPGEFSTLHVNAPSTTGAPTPTPASATPTPGGSTPTPIPTPTPTPTPIVASLTISSTSSSIDNKGGSVTITCKVTNGGTTTNIPLPISVSGFGVVKSLEWNTNNNNFSIGDNGILSTGNGNNYKGSTVSIQVTGTLTDNTTIDSNILTFTIY